MNGMKLYTELHRWNLITQFNSEWRGMTLQPQCQPPLCLWRPCMWYKVGVAKSVTYARHDPMATTWRCSWGLGKKEGRGLEIFTEGRRGFLREKRLEERRVWSQVKCVRDLL